MSRLTTAACVLVVVSGMSAGGATSSGGVDTKRRVFTFVGPARFLSPHFGYVAASRTVEQAGKSRIAQGLFLYRRGRWINVTPTRLKKSFIRIDDIAFTDPRHGWIATYDCADAAGGIYQTRDGGHSWRLLGNAGGHSCSAGGTTFLSFADRTHGWMEPISPTGPVADLLRTVDGGRTWKEFTRDPPCLAPIAFVSRMVGWMGRCAARIFLTRTAGRRWSRVRIRVPVPAQMHTYDLTRFFGTRGVLAATLGHRTSSPELLRVRPRMVAFMVSNDRGRTWSLRSLRHVARCNSTLFSPWGPQAWPASVATRRIWWVVSGKRRQHAQVTTDGGRRWRTTAARGLPARPCSVVEVSAANARLAWVVAKVTGRNTWLFQTRDGGHTWRRAHLPLR